MFPESHNHLRSGCLAALCANAVSRRSVLGAIASLGVSFALPAMSLQAAQRRRAERPMSLVTLFMQGGMSQLETFDPHPGSPAGGQTTAIRTTVPEIQISSLLPRTAEQMHSALLIRSLTSREGDHERGVSYAKTGYRPEQTLKYPSIGAIAARELPDPAVEIPQHVSLAADRWFAVGGYLGNQWDAFRVFDPGNSLANLKANVEDGRQAARLRSLAEADDEFQKRHRFGAPKTLHRKTVDDAVRMMSSEQLNALILDDESDAVRKAYGDSRFGRGCLVARRLVETGVRSIEVTLNGFDTHADNYDGHVTQCNVLDPALATLIQELRERDLLESTIVLCISEFGRTPRINPAGGRDHWPHWFSGLV
ncbi:MAG: DUF1501 domain-containing protein, partial [Planctomycetaceae bacterium]|nr:DUF1501 domain-containing protein [Planctomycetaceae bacterium]